MKRRITYPAALLVTTGLMACATTPPPGPSAEAKLEARSGSSVSGSVKLSAVGSKLVLDIDAAGLTPGAHGFHVHDSGDCSAADATSAKGHFNPAGKSHGHHGGSERHAGDMQNLVADSAGNAKQRIEVEGLGLVDGPTNVINRSIVIHADADDYSSQPAGNSGKRIACGTIRSL